MRWGLVILAVTLAVIAAYIGFLVWYVARLAGEQRAHLAWELKLGAMRDLVPDILPDGTLCCGAGETLNWVNPDGTQKASYTMPGLGQGVAWYAGAGGLWFVAPAPANTPAGSGRAKLMALNERAEVAWETPLPQGVYANWVCFSDDQVYCALDTSIIVALDLKGNLRWTKQVGPPPAAQAPAQQSQQQQQQQYYLPRTQTALINGMGASPAGDVYYTSDKRELVALDRDGQQRWTATLGAINQHRPTLAPDGTLLVLDDNGTMTALSPDGKQKWVYRSAASAPGSLGFSPYGGSYGGYGGNGRYTGVGPDGTAYFCDYSNQLYAVDVAGQLKWRRDIGGECVAPAVGKDGRVYVAVAGRGVTAYSPAGKLLWRCRCLKDISSAPILGPEGQLYVETSESLVALEP